MLMSAMFALHRRRLSASQRAGAIVACNEWRNEGRVQLRNFAELPKTAAQLAEAAQVSTRTIESAKSAQTAGLGELVRDGKASASAAAELAKSAPLAAAKVAAKEQEFDVAFLEIKKATSASHANEKQQIGRTKRELPTVPSPDLNAELDRMEAQIMDMRAELIELRAASHDEQLRNQARDEISGLREALALEQRLHSALKSQRETVEHQLNDWKKRCAALERQLYRRERGE
jgi:hypothetical protein